MLDPAGTVPATVGDSHSVSEVEGLTVQHGLAAAGAGFADGFGQQPGTLSLVLGAIATLGGVPAATVDPPPDGRRACRAAGGAVGEGAAVEALPRSHPLSSW
ncbi:hypothetical protein ACFQE5_22265 [Pseudonocardia hispaniensis]|uniref:Uncharacterized protein n=1 Tax=Pseudonocardia hispaniensis TaxID=904933 RepID=A0ABW1J8S0_9PSEU